MASTSELSLDCKPYSHSMLLKSFGHDQTQKLEDFLSRLEEERLKIDAFKRELPLCMQLLTNAVETSRQQLQAYRANDHQGHQRPILEEFIPLKQYSNSDQENSDKAANISDKASWMTTAQLWCQTTSNINEGSNKQQSTITSSSPTTTQETENIMGFNIVSPKLNLDTKQRNGGAFLPFSKDGATRGVTELALISSKGEEMEDKKCFQGDNNGGVVNEPGKAQIHTANEAQGATTNATTTSGNSNQTHRKARRCWSPDLHRRFVNALQMLGGSQAVATPKQIRELMKVDGLTNDEVKSHLQKYRLHTRRPSCPSPQAAGTTPPQLVVLGGIWVPPEYAAAAAHSGGPTMTTLYSAAHPASHAAAHYCQPPVPSHHLPQDHHFYTNNNINALPSPTHHHRPHHHGQLLHHQLQVYNSSSQTHSSPEFDGRGNGDRSESIEDGKSESSSWKGDSGENGGERKGLAALREDGEESNASEITLKF